MKHHPSQKTYRNHLLKDFARTHPELPLWKIGEIFQITHQRVTQIIGRR